MLAPLRSLAAPLLLLLAAAAVLPPQTEALDQQLYGINYDLRQGADWDPKRCKPEATIAADLKVLKTISSNLRTYALADCDIAPVLRTAKSLGMTVWVGVWVAADPEVYNAEVKALDALIAANLIDKNVVGFNVGSEAVYRKDITAEKAIEYLTDFKSVLAKNSISTPVSITDIVDVLTAYPDMVKASDVVTANQFPFWEKIDASKAVAQFDKRIQPLITLAGGKEVVISETGWPTGGSNVNASLATPEGAARYLNDFVVLSKERGWKYYYFAGFDTPHKAEQAKEPDTVEQFFGIFGTDRVMKTAYANLKIAKIASTDTSSDAGTDTSSTDKWSGTSSTATDSAGGKSTRSDSTDSTSPGTVHAGNTNSTGKSSSSSTTKSDSTSSSTTKNGTSSTNSTNATNTSNSTSAASPIAAASLTACLAIVSAVLMSL